MLDYYFAFLLTASQKKYLAEDPNDDCPIREAGRTNSAIINVATTAANFAPQKSSKAFFFWRTKFAAK